MRLSLVAANFTIAFALLFVGALKAENANASPIYHGGPILTAPVDVYYIYYGRWLGRLPFPDPDFVFDFSNLDSFIPNLTGSSYANILMSYGASTQFNFRGQTIIAPGDSLYEGNDLDANPNNLTDSIESIVTTALAASRLPTDPNGVYFVVTDPFINIPGFNGNAPIAGAENFCAWHSSTNWYTNTLGIQYGFIGDPGPTISGCGEPIQYVPDVNFEADAMENEIAHELFETVTDPTGGGYWDSISPLGSAQTRGDEVADICAWNFGTTYKDAEGGNANVNLNGRDYLLQEQWHNEGGGVDYSGGECVQGLANAIPEPMTLPLFGAGIFCIAAMRRRGRTIRARFPSVIRG